MYIQSQLFPLGNYNIIEKKKKPLIIRVLTLYEIINKICINQPLLPILQSTHHKVYLVHPVACISNILVIYCISSFAFTLYAFIAYVVSLVEYNSSIETTYSFPS